MTMSWQRAVPLLLLLLLLLLSNRVIATRRKTVYISEFSYNQQNGDFVEFVGPKGWKFINTFLSFYAASSNHTTGVLVDVAPLNPSVVEETSSTSSKIFASQSIFVYRSEDLPELSGDVAVGAIALSVVTNGVPTTLHYVSYGGTFNTTEGGLADGLVPADVGVVESTDDGESDVTSIQLEVESETWESRCSTPGQANRALLNRAAPLNLTLTPAKPWINEFHYTDSGGGTNVFIEVGGPEKMPLEGYVLSIYQASRGGAATLVQCIELEAPQLVDNAVNTVAFFNTSELSIPHGVDKVTAIALSASLEAGSLYDYISFHGIGASAPSSTLNGPAAGSLPIDVLVRESFPETAVGTSLQRQDVPLCLNDDNATVVWSDGLAQSPGLVNVNQEAIVTCALPFNPWIVTDAPTLKPSFAPSSLPSRRPTAPTAPTNQPTLRPTAQPSIPPTLLPTSGPTVRPTHKPSAKPTVAPTTAKPTMFSTSSPTFRPSHPPTPQPSVKPSPRPSTEPTHNPTAEPSSGPSASPSAGPATAPSASPSVSPSMAPSMSPSALPSTSPSSSPSAGPSSAPSSTPSTSPSSPPSSTPTISPSSAPTNVPTASPTLCANRDDFQFFDLVATRFQNCEWIQEKTARQETYCFSDAFSIVGAAIVRQNCRAACGLCTSTATSGGAVPPLVLAQNTLSDACPAVSTDNADFRFTIRDDEKPCRFIAKKGRRIRKFCKKRRIRRNCSFSCRGCREES